MRRRHGKAAGMGQLHAQYIMYSRMMVCKYWNHTLCLSGSKEVALPRYGEAAQMGQLHEQWVMRNRMTVCKY